MKFSSRDTQLLKGVTIILMLCNHIFVKEMLLENVEFISIHIGHKTLAEFIGGFSKICVSVFAFLSGIGLFYTYSKNNFLQAYIHTLKKLIAFLISYWLILCTVFLPLFHIYIGIEFNIQELLLNMIGFKNDYIGPAWYVYIYINIVVFFPVFLFFQKLWMSERKSLFKDFAFLLIWNVLSILFMSFAGTIANILKEPITYYNIVISGFFVAKNQLLERLAEKFNNRWSIIGYSFILGIIFILRGKFKYLGSFYLDTLYAPIFVFSIWRILDFMKFEKAVNVLYSLGKYSTEFWFLHWVFYIGIAEFQQFVYSPKISILIPIWMFILLTPFAYLFRYISKCISKRILLIRK